MHIRPCSQLALLLAAVALTGCANMTTTALDDTSAQSNLSGIVHGGRQPVANATVTLWAAGNRGYGSTATSLATTTTDASGTFAFQPTPGYTCPAMISTTTSQYLYLTVSGGQPTTGITNAQAAFLLALGSCSAVKAANPTVNIDELTTVASITALQQFFKPDTTNGLGSIGTSPGNITGLANAMALVPNMVNTTTGQSFATTTASGAVTGFTTNPTVTITPEQSKLDTMADILAACVNTSGSNAITPTACNTLYANAGSATPLDTLQAAYYMATTPAGVGTAASCATGTAVTTAPSICTLYGLVTSSAPYQPTLAAAPTDWTLGITYATAAAQTIASTSVYLMTRPETLAIDATGNVWIDNYALNGTTLGTVGNSVFEMSPTGVPLAQVLINAPGTTTGTLLDGSFSMAFDPTGNLFVTNYGKSGTLQSYVAEYTTTGSTYVLPTKGAGDGSIVSDGAGNIFVATVSSTGGGADLEYIPANPTSTSSFTQLQTGVIDTSFSEIAVDANETVWLSSAATANGTQQFLCTVATAITCSAPVKTTVGGQVSPEPLAIDSSNNVWIGGYSTTVGGVSEILANSTGSGFSGNGIYPTTYVNSIEKVALDGAGNVWLASVTNSAGTVAEISNTGVLLSPSATTAGFSHTYGNPNKLAIDKSGNVWVGNAATTTEGPNGFITEIVGAAVPVITPVAAGLPATPTGVSKLGTRP
jgi:hypothetical protein